MKIIAIGRNYAEHIAELENERPEEPVIFTKPETALLKDGLPFYHPEFSENIHHEIEIVVRINKMGKYIQKKFAKNYYDAIGLGIDFTARDLQSKLKQKGLPWDIAKGFNDSSPISEFLPVENFSNLQDIDFSLKVNGEVRQAGNTAAMLWQIDEIIAYVSQFFTLKKGDYIFTGTPKGVDKVNIGDRLEGFIGEQKMLDFEVK
ncbi:fumarylacetoacetate hydrolase family protein [Sediminitomix flava]|uniref:2-keto-4-pentenoate hydratase/2-oxohepta-3-ene-1,7-dioic acid hydratase in catechol pathway n=1 Tax=Sediminitomix flava TaxID=379075 RepID=A0A315ZTM2_SEDFL|nr:fumarylacetoacetate hydrolase family protein [Sediminitomix flava]PWJ38584.1 2-keto-4-pentenoate hydratase/2-oxohepta-3-ene-1,7-dioic acid hydratase in catechol pathway [Sediminitomix flava]